MRELRQNFDLLAIVALAIIFGLADAPGLHSRIVRARQEHSNRDVRILQLDRVNRLERLVYRLSIAR